MSISNRNRLCLEQKPSDFQAFVEAMRAAGFTVGDSKKHLRFLVPGKEKYTRCDTLKGDYTVQAIKERIEGKRIVTLRKESEPLPTNSNAPKMNLLIDIENSIKAKDNPGYEQWAKVFNVKQAAKILMFLQQNNLTDYDKLTEESELATKRFNEISARIKLAGVHLKEINA